MPFLRIQAPFYKKTRFDVIFFAFSARRFVACQGVLSARCFFGKKYRAHIDKRAGKKYINCTACRTRMKTRAQKTGSRIVKTTSSGPFFSGIRT